MTDPMKNAWNDVADSFSKLGQTMKDRYRGAGEETDSFAEPEGPAETASGKDPTAALREAFDQLLAAGREFGERTTGFVRDDAVRDQFKNVATSINDALEATLDQIGKEARGFFKPSRREDGAAPAVDGTEHAAAPPGDAERDVLP
jgi:hypothetical protein